MPLSGSANAVDVTDTTAAQWRTAGQVAADHRTAATVIVRDPQSVIHKPLRLARRSLRGVVLGSSSLATLLAQQGCRGAAVVLTQRVANMLDDFVGVLTSLAAHVQPCVQQGIEQPEAAGRDR
jgi:hypothetical protein